MDEEIIKFFLVAVGVILGAIVTYVRDNKKGNLDRRREVLRDIILHAETISTYFEYEAEDTQSYYEAQHGGHAFAPSISEAEMEVLKKEFPTAEREMRKNIIMARIIVGEEEAKPLVERAKAMRGDYWELVNIDDPTDAHSQCKIIAEQANHIIEESLKLSRRGFFRQ